MSRLNLFVLFAFFTGSILNCTGNKNSTSEKIPGDISSIVDPNPLIPSVPISTVSASPKEAEKLVAEVQQNSNQDPLYALTNDDLNVLSTEGLAEESELKGWVK